MNIITTGEWIAVIGILLTVIIGVIQIIKKNDSKSGTINANQSAGLFSKSKQKINIKVNQNDK
jgi:hypothetical protein